MRRRLWMTLTLCLLPLSAAGAQQQDDARQGSDRQQRFDDAQQQQRIQRLQSDINRREHGMSGSASGSRTERRLEENSLRQDRRRLQEERRDSQRPSPGTNRQVHPSDRSRSP
ncbi:hypothetical protein C7446_2688 [Kushneria sinocarnis]|uniref:Uncharacterized protein n=1 Tax=Kushneria sinocarnis TaxID=595502 RepID=A0A420WV06_9GAMM|nr:hypothetical protein [Kushneria sinocarnis]RKQ97263.1 hypothetical protein C7446_2688 [Kushneria sinocarnis]